MKPMHHPELLREIETFLAETGMGPTYFGKVAAGNPGLVGRLKTPGRRVWPETERAVRDFMRSHREAGSAAQ